MIYRFEILTATESYEGWAHDPDEMQDKARKQLPKGTDFVIFLTAAPPEAYDMSLDRIRELRAEGKMKREDGSYHRDYHQKRLFNKY